MANHGVKAVSFISIMQTKAFRFGYEDASKQLNFRRGYEKWGGKSQWDYERGRQLAACLRGEGAGSMPVRLNGKVNQDLLRKFAAAYRLGDIT